ncbi:MAG: DUF433 domain-containing protein [Okeania sp. SIO2C9]|uniref:DUF433 domain-containing protein n=1 Tax=Okeania sp. SIO2C9 TaxID=2607791 RepID=UPI0013BEDC6C|nr:DUF433 domain-containing protein [Okeania sp. SIO2C9]NEQ77197.1 DUF433 domain-containing protein [Okeania sp. SIO2C9]
MLKHLDKITFYPKIMTGKACIRGMRIPISLILNLVANGKPNQEILEEYPDLELEDIKQCLFYAVLLAEERVISIEKKQELESVK